MMAYFHRRSEGVVTGMLNAASVVVQGSAAYTSRAHHSLISIRGGGIPPLANALDAQISFQEPLLLGGI